MGKKANQRRQKQPNNQRGYATSNIVINAVTKTIKAKNSSAVTSAVGNPLQTQTQTPQTSTSLVVSSQNHDDLLHLLGTLHDETSTTTTTTTIITALQTSPDRFYKKMYHIHDTLTQLGFDFGHIQRVVMALGFAIDLELALDWLCLHLETHELPPLLTEGTVREQQQQQQQQATAILTVEKPVVASRSGGISTASTDNKESMPMPTPIIDMVTTKPKGESPPKEEEQQDQNNASKAWVLQQYQYADEEDLDENHVDNDNPEELQTTHVSHGGDNFVHDDIITTPSQPTPIQNEQREADPNEKRLAELEKQLQLQVAELNDDASNYMKSKHEIKELKISTNKLRKQVEGLRKGLRKKVERTKKEQQAAPPPPHIAAAAAAAAAVKKEQEDQDQNTFCGGFFGSNQDDDDEEEEESNVASFFEQSTQSAAVKSNNDNNSEQDKDLPPPTDPVVPKDSIPSGWTGKTPKQVLEEWCQKQKIRRPQFFNLPFQNGARIRVDTKPTPTTLETDNYMGSYADAQQYLATKVLYQLSPADLPLYRLFPPYYRDLWRSWTDTVQKEHDAAQQQEEDALKAKIQQLINSIPKPSQSDKTNSSQEDEKKSSTSSQSLSTTLPVRDTWEDDDDEADSPLETILMTKAQLVDGVDQQMSAVSSTKAPSDSKPTRVGVAIQKEFAKRQATNKYQAMLEARSSLPMYGYREQVLQTIRQNSVTILCAETGAGKTTQCPQFILEEAFSSGIGDRVSIICTQPRRVAATSVAERVAEEMAEPALGETVGYQIRLEAKRSSKTRLLFCTTGVILRRLQENPMLTGITHICVDEVHERQYQVDCLLVMLRQLLRNGRPDLKIILMSATLDAKLFCSFFGGAPVLNVPGRTFPVAVYHLEDLLEGTNHIVEEGSRYALRDERGRRETASVQITTRGGESRKEVHSLDSGGTHLSDVSDDYPGYSSATRRSMDRVNEEIINYDLIEDVLLILLVNPERNESLLPPEGADLSEGAVLIFLPGFGEIRTLTERLEGSRSLGNKQRFDIIPMHSTLSPQDQRRAFIKPKKGCRKIILSTNIAETSVTIPDVVAVIDAGRVREVRVDKRTSTSRLVTDWCSRASAKQRAGRAGRVQPGICLKLYSSLTVSQVMKEAAQPEIRRVPLEDVCLTILAGSFADSCMEFLNQTPQPPSEEAVRSALRVLRDVGAIELVEKDTKDKKTSEQLTSLGRHLAKLPVDVRLGKMLIFGCLFTCIDPVLTVAASLSCKSPFSAFVNDALQAKAKHKVFAHENSDFLTLCNVWEAYENASSSGMTKARNFCYDNYLSFSALREIADTRRHFVELLFGIGFLDRSRLSAGDTNGGDKRKTSSQDLQNSLYNVNRYNFDVVHSVICAGLYPNVGHLVPNESGSGERHLWHRKERLYFHPSSVNSKLKTTCRYPTSWIAFHEKFGTQHRVSVSSTCFVHPFAILVFGGPLVVKHTERKVIVDDWIEIPMAAQTGVMFREVRTQVDRLLQGFLQVKDSKNGTMATTTAKTTERQRAMVKGVVRLLSTETTK